MNIDNELESGSSSLPAYLTVDQVAGMLHVDDRTIHRWAATRPCPSSELAGWCGFRVSRCFVGCTTASRVEGAHGEKNKRTNSGRRSLDAERGPGLAAGPANRATALPLPPDLANERAELLVPTEVAGSYPTDGNWMSRRFD